MAYLNGRNVGLDGVLAQQANYRKSGFTLAYRNIRTMKALPATRTDHCFGVTTFELG